MVGPLEPFNIVCRLTTTNIFLAHSWNAQTIKVVKHNKFSLIRIRNKTYSLLSKYIYPSPRNKMITSTSRSELGDVDGVSIPITKNTGYVHLLSSFFSFEEWLSWSLQNSFINIMDNILLKKSICINEKYFKQLISQRSNIWM